MKTSKVGAPDPVRAKLAEQANTPPQPKGFNVIQMSGRPGQKTGLRPAAKTFYHGPHDFLGAHEFFNPLD